MKQKYPARKTLLLILMAVVLIGTACQSSKNNTKSTNTQTSANLEPESIKVKTLTGTETDIQNIFSQAELTVVNIWNPSCTACENDMKILGQLGREYAGRGVQIVGIISEVTEEQDEASLSMTESTDADYTQILDSPEIKKKFLDESLKLPVSLLVDQKGNVLETVHSGDMTAAQWKDVIEDHHSQICIGDHPADRGVG